jgi:hypothetical protein
MPLYPVADQLGYALVFELIMHGPCRELNDECGCMIKNAYSRISKEMK